jgi:hypothetical protein
MFVKQRVGASSHFRMDFSGNDRLYEIAILMIYIHIYQFTSNIMEKQLIVNEKNNNTLRSSFSDLYMMISNEQRVLIFNIHG